MKFWLLSPIVLFFALSCEFFKPKELIEEVPIATVFNGKSLYRSDLEGLFPKKTSSNDSSILTEKYVDDWIKKQLMIAEANEKTQLNEAEIERKVLEYRYVLIVHTFTKNYIDKNLDLYVRDSTIERYYNQKADNFLLKQNIIKCIFAKISKNAPNLRQFRRNFRAYPNTNDEDFKSYLTQFSVKSYVEDSVWLPFSELTAGTPLESLNNDTQFLRKTQYSETSDANYTYLLKIFDYKVSEEISPLQFIKDDIVNIIINKRKIELKKRLEEKIYDEAIKNDRFEIYTD
jgi:hypothetical protein